MSLTASSLKNLLKRSWDILSFRIYREAYQMVWQAVAVYGFKTKALKGSEDWSTRVDCIVQRICDSENAICWGVDCAHVARYMNKSYEEYCQEASHSGKLLYRLHYAVNSKDAELIHEAMNEASQYVDAYQKAYANRKEVARPGDVARDLRSDDGEQGTLPGMRTI